MGKSHMDSIFSFPLLSSSSHHRVYHYYFWTDGFFIVRNGSFEGVDSGSERFHHYIGELSGFPYFVGC